MYLPEGPTRPSIGALNEFWRAARAANSHTDFPADYQVRWIGLRISGKPGQHFTPRRATVSRMVGRWVERLRDEVDCVAI